MAGDALGVGDCGRVGKSGAGGEGGFVAFGNIGDAQCDLRGAARGGLREAAAFRGGEMAADYVDFFDGRAAGDQDAMKFLEICERDFWI